MPLGPNYPSVLPVRFVPTSSFSLPMLITRLFDAMSLPLLTIGWLHINLSFVFPILWNGPNGQTVATNDSSDIFDKPPVTASLISQHLRSISAC